MIRIVIENVIFFLLPTILYIAWTAFREDSWPGLRSVMAQAPLAKLFVAGAFLMLATLALFSSHSPNRPTDVYEPPAYRDGKLEPGHRVDPPVAK